MSAVLTLAWAVDNILFSRRRTSSLELNNQMIDADEFYVGLGARIRRARLDAEMTQEELASKLSLNRTSITNIEKGAQKMLVDTLVRLAQEVGVPPASLLPTTDIQLRSPNVNKLVPRGTTRDQKEFLNSVLTARGKRTQ